MEVYHNRLWSDKRLLFTFVEYDLAKILGKDCSFFESILLLDLLYKKNQLMYLCLSHND